MLRAPIAVLVLAIAAATPGCKVFQKAFNDVSSNHYYHKDGYHIDGPYAFFDHTETPNQNVMTMGFAYGQKILTDKECDNKVDVIELKGERYNRDEPGTESLFAQADSEWQYCYDSMHIPEVDAKWRAMDPTTLGQTNGYSKYPH